MPCSIFRINNFIHSFIQVKILKFSTSAQVSINRIIYS